MAYYKQGKLHLPPLADASADPRSPYYIPHATRLAPSTFGFAPSTQVDADPGWDASEAHDDGGEQYANFFAQIGKAA